MNKWRERNKALFTSESYEWSTPDWLFRELDNEFNFTIDVCASDGNTKCQLYYTQKDDALSQEWKGVCWMNPPYGRSIKYWIQKAYESSLNGATVVCLVPARTDTEWWHSYCIKGEIRFLKGRLYFSNHGKTGRAPFPSAIVIFQGNNQ